MKRSSLILLMILVGCKVDLALDGPWNVDAILDTEDLADAVGEVDVPPAADTVDAGDDGGADDAEVAADVQVDAAPEVEGDAAIDADAAPDQTDDAQSDALADLDTPDAPSADTTPDTDSSDALLVDVAADEVSSDTIPDDAEPDQEGPDAADIDAAVAEDTIDGAAGDDADPLADAEDSAVAADVAPATDATQVDDVAEDTTDDAAADADAELIEDTADSGDSGPSDPCLTLNCNDGNSCTNDSCEGGGCVHLANAVTCEDGSACTGGDGCQDKSCVAGQVVGCGDGNACTDDSCDAVLGCLNLANSSTCEDGDACTAGDVCVGEGCVGGAAVGCDDGVTCTTDSCDPGNGCVNVDNTVACDDGNACTTGDVCSDGVCTPGSVGCAANAKCVSGTGCACNPGFWGDGAVCTCGGTISSSTIGGVATNVCAYDYPVWGNRPDSPDTYTVNGDGTVSDSQTQLMWQQVTDGNTYSWAEAGTYCDGLVLAGKDDWRLPTVAEGESLVDYASGSPQIYATAFPGTAAQPHWTAVKYVGGPSTSAWYLNFTSSESVGYDEVTLSRAVRCVRTQDAFSGAGQRFTVAGSNPNGVVADSATGLVWQQTAPTGEYGWSATLASGSAQDYCNSLSIGSLTTGWRIPSERELLSLVDRSVNIPAIDALLFPGAGAGNMRYWSSTPWPSGLPAWYVNFYFGSSNSSGALTSAHVRCVHDNSCATSCDDSSACTWDICIQGTCSHTAVNCDDAFPCTTDGCNPATGCTHDTQDGLCDDGNVCTDDLCVAAVGCVNPPNAATCADAVACAVDVACTDGACSSVGPKLWSKFYTGASRISRLRDAGGGLIAAFGESASDKVAVVLMLDHSGVVQSKLEVDGDPVYGDQFADAVRLPGGDWIAVGLKRNNYAQQQHWVVRLTAEGTVVWNISPSPSGTGSFISASLFSNGDVLAVGQSFDTGGQNRKATVARITASGTIVWQNTTDQNLNDGTAHPATMFSDDTFSIVGGYISATEQRYASTGTKIGSNLSVSVFAVNSSIGGATAATGGGLWFTGNGQAAFAAPWAGWIGKISAEDTLVRSTIFPSVSGQIFSIAEDNIGGLLAAGEDMISVDAHANLRWSRTSGAMQGSVRDILSLSDGTVVVAGSGLTQSGAWVSRMDLSGNTTCADAGSCAAASAPSCDDNNSCTADLCDAAHGGCWHTTFVDGAACDDGNACTSGESCLAGTCGAGNTLLCATNATCDPGVGCVCSGGFWGSGALGGSCSCGGTVTAITTSAGSKNVCAYDYPVWGNRGISPNTYKDNGDGTVSDSQTQLMWQQVTSGTYTWADARTYCDALSLGGYDDWRLPTVAEGESIYDYTLPAPCISGAAFPGAASGKHWTAVPKAADSASSWSVTLESGVSSSYDAVATASTVRCVRATAAWQPPAARFTVSGSSPNAAVVDSATGLSWQQTVSGSAYTWSASAAAGSAQAYCNTLSLNGYSSGWRVPTERELLSIVDRTAFNPSTDAAAFPSTPVGVYWSATPMQDGSGSAWIVSFNIGYSNYYLVGSNSRVRCVHD